MSQHWNTFWTEGELLLRGVGHIMGCRGRPCQDCTGFIMGHLGEKPEVGKGMDLDDLGRNKSGKIER